MLFNEVDESEVAWPVKKEPRNSELGFINEEEYIWKGFSNSIYGIGNLGSHVTQCVWYNNQ